MAQIRLFDLPDIDAIITDGSIRYIIKTIDQIGNGSLSGTSRTYKSYLLARFCIQCNIMKNCLTRIITKIYIFKTHITCQPGISNRSIAVGMFPCPDTGTFFVL